MPPKSKKAIQLRKEINGAVNKNDLLIIQSLLELNKPSTLIEIIEQLGLGTNQSQTDQPDFIETVSDTLQKAVTCGFIQMIDKRFYLYPITVTKSMKAISGDYDRSRSKRVNRNTWNTCKTITGLTFRDGVIIAIDIRRKTSSKIPSGRSKEIFRLQDNIYAAGVGFADDKKTLADLLHAKLDRHRIKMGREVPVVCANQIIKQLFYRFKRTNRMDWIIAGVDRGRPSIFGIRFSGSNRPGPYVALGLGEAGAIATLESRWKENLPEEEAKLLAIDAVRAAIQTDRGKQRQAGSTVHFCIIRSDYLVKQGYKAIVEMANRIRYKRMRN